MLLPRLGWFILLFLEPFYDNVYYPLEPEKAQMSPDMLRTPWIPRPSTPNRMPSYNHDSRFKFRTRHESVDWRRIGAIDADRLANELDFVTLQENIMGITFCNIGNEKCPHCHSSLDPVLLKLFRLSQYTIEYLLHTQEYLTTNLQTLEEKVRATLAETEQVQAKMVKQTQEVKALKEDCKRKKKIISTQQMLISTSAGPYHKCQHCEKAFMNHSYLQSHMTRRHPGEQQHVQASNNLQHEMNCLKEELQLTKSQLEAEHKAHLEKISQMQENEHRKTTELNILKEFDNWKKEEREKFEEELNKVREMFMKELKEVTSKNSCLENKNPSLTNELRKVLEQGVVEKLESLGVKPGVRGVPSDHFNRILDAVETFREEKEKLIPEFPKIRQNLIKHIDQKVEERASATVLKLNSGSQLFTDVFSTIKSPTLRSMSSNSLPKQKRSRTSILKSSNEELRTEPRYPIPVISSTPKIKLVSSKEARLTKPSSITTPPFSSDDDESDLQDESVQLHKHYSSLKSKSSLNGKVNIGFTTTESESDGSVLEEIKPQLAQKRAPAKPPRG
ncbi:hypothetical protein GDO78_000599 [Eleutherodactylus coqui]|uniref:C2H2-type domain-containing protein n=1 Tax=Eleutherodactylus coqui TaxID=57060 RepID=A0A8J6KHW5_ELECQ|nr:hypothetical protein GDO78_000599 [Eleutherodactylus coqui]